MNTTIKTEEPSSNDNDGMASCSSSINTANASIHVKKEQKDHDDGDDVCATSRSRRIARLQIKKEEEENDDEDDDNKNSTDMNCKININEPSTGDNYCDNDSNYSGWKNGNWCWLLPAKDNNGIKSEEGGGTNTATSPTMASSGKRTAARSHSTSHHEYGTTTDVDDDDDETSQLLPPKKKTRSLKQHPPLNNRNNDTVVEQQKEGENACHKEGAKIRDVDEGYESWTEGNWCWLLHTSRTNAEQDPSSDEEIDDAEITSSSSSSSSHVCRDHDPSSSGLLEEEEEEENYEDEDGDDISEINAKSQNERWNEMFRRLVSYKKQYNSPNVPLKYAVDPELGNWVSSQRQSYMTEKISESRIRRLESIGFVWKILDNQWDEMFNRLITYKNQHHGSTQVPVGYEKDPKFAAWVRTQRWNYNQSKKILSLDRIKRLESIGFVWDVLDMKWMKMYDRLVAYKKKYKTTQVPSRYTGDNQLPHLGSWVNKQRFYYRDGKLLKKRVECLNFIDFEWETK